MKTLMAVVMQNGLMIQQLQLMVVLKQKEIKEEEQREENKWRKQKEAEEEEEKQKELREEELRMMKTWTEDKSQKYVERFRGYRGNMRCKKCEWFGHMACHCKREEIEAEKEQRGGLCGNRWELLKSRVMSCKEDQKAACSVRREAQQLVECLGCGEEGHHL